MTSRVINRLILNAIISITSLVICADELAIVPKPVEATLIKGQRFKLTPGTRISYSDVKAKGTAELLAEFLRSATGLKLPVSKGTTGADTILLKLEDVGMGDEGYTLSISSKGVTVAAVKPAGLIFGVQTIRQLLPPQIYSRTAVSRIEWSMPAVRIKDKPRFSWRGLHLDVCRHYVSKDFIKKFIDLLSIHKMNVFHWHLTEDQAWRIEIKKYPKLTEIGAWRPGTGFGLDPKSTTHYNEKGQYGGYYSQEDVKEIVAYATRRGVTIVPEIELPGHSLAALSAYPQYGCTGGPYKILMRGGISRDVYCAGNDETLKFLGNILNEVADLFPGTYFHIGGDECPKQSWKKCPKCQKRIKDNKLHGEHGLQSWVIKWAEKTLAKKGKRLIGWDEILEGGLAPNAAVMSWRGTRGGIKAAQMGHNVVMSPTSHCYLDYKQAAKGEPKSMGHGVLDMKRVYSFEPMPKNLPADKIKHILGAQGNLWTEYMANEKHVEYMAYPRACALAEVTWSPKDHRNWSDFSKRMGTQYARLGVLDVNARIPFDLAINETKPGTATIKTTMAGATIHYTLDGTEPTASSTKYTETITVTKMTSLRTLAILKGGKKSFEQQKVLLMPKIIVTTSLSQYEDNAPNRVVDGDSSSVFWSNRPPTSKDHVTITFETPTALNGLSVLSGKVGGGDELENGVVEVSTDGTTFKQIGTFEKGKATTTTSGKIKVIRIKPTKTQKSWLVIREVLLK